MINSTLHSRLAGTNAADYMDLVSTVNMARHGFVSFDDDIQLIIIALLPMFWISEALVSDFDLRELLRMFEGAENYEMCCRIRDRINDRKESEELLEDSDQLKELI